MLIFNAERHEYRVDGVVLPSVTQVLRSCYDFSMVAPDVLEHKRQIGTAVHVAIKLDIDNDLVEESVAPELRGYLAAWREFRADTGLTAAEFGECEKPMYHPTYGYAGTPDVTAHLNGRWSVIDAKCVDALHPAWALQLAGYQELVNANTKKGEYKIERRYSLRLMVDGKYRLDEWQDRNDWNVFLAMLAARRWCEANLRGTS